MSRIRKIKPSFTHKPALTVAGISTRTNNERENNPETARIPALWDRFYREAIPAQIPGAGGVVGVVHAYESDHAGNYTSLAGVIAEDRAAVPDAYDVVTLSAGDYLVFRSEGPVPESVLAGWQAVWDYFAEEGPYERSYTADYELYEDEAVAIHIAVRSSTKAS